MNNKDILRVQVGFNWLLSQCKVCNQLLVIKPSASATIRDVIGYFHEIYLTLAGSSLVVVVANGYAQDGFQRHPNSSHLCLGVILTVVELVNKKHCRAATIKRARPTLGKNKSPSSPLRKHMMKLIVSKLAYWPVWIDIANRKSSKAIVSVPTLVYRSIFYHAIYQYHSIYHAFSQYHSIYEVVST